MLPISICIIAKNEESNIENCLKPLRVYDWEIIVVDTGSTDRTREIAGRYADKVLDYTWCDDFAAARNYSIGQASHDTILVIDSDEYLTEVDVEAMQQLASQNPTSVGLLSRENHYQLNGTDSVYVDLVERLFSRKYYHYEGIIHEQVRLREPDRYTYETYQIPLILNHSGYSGSEESLREKAMRNISLLEKNLETHPDNPYTYFQIGQAYNMIHDDVNACLYYGKGLSYDVDPAAEYVQMMVIGYGYALLHLNRAEEALGLNGVYDAFAVSADFFTLMGLIYLRNGQYMNALLEFVKALSCDKAHVVGSNSFIPSYNIGLINEMMGDTEAALMHYRKCGDFPMALEKIQELTN
ncbi:MAG: glycosyltransferase family 2 protein [Lachnospiraceae bacterium]|nr:glycosyltransferase family 2 protein [Lachnospiraceae bacterium]